MNKGAKIGIGIGVTALLAATAYFALTYRGRQTWHKLTGKTSGGSFDWVGAASGKAGVHLSTPELKLAKVAEGDEIGIYGSNWTEMEGKSANIIKLNRTAGTMILDTNPPSGSVSGKWKKVK